MNLAYFFKRESTFIGISEKFSTELALDAFYLFFSHEGDRYTGLANSILLLNVPRIFDIDEGIVAALIGQMAEASTVDVVEDAGEHGEDVLCVFLVFVDDVVGLFKHFEEFSYL
jgi:hypothetical protein